MSSKDKLLETIKLIVRKELSNTLKPLIKTTLKSMIREMVESEVNSILAEKFIQNISPQQTIVREQRVQSSPAISAPTQNKTISEDRKKELLRKMGVDNDPMSKLIYEDVDINEGGEDDDDPGVDISIFGL